MNQQLRIETVGRFIGVFLGAVVSIAVLILVGQSVETSEASMASDIYLLLAAGLLVGVYIGVTKLAERYGRNKAAEDLLASQAAGKEKLAQAGLTALPGIGDAPSLLDWQAHETIQEFLEEGETVLGYASGWVSALDSLFVVTDRGVHILRVNRNYARHPKGFHFFFSREDGVRLKAADADRNDQRFGFTRRYKLANLAEGEKDILLLLWLYAPARTGLSNSQDELFDSTLQEMQRADFAAEEAEEGKGLTGKFRNLFRAKRF